VAEALGAVLGGLGALGAGLIGLFGGVVVGHHDFRSSQA
jgi:hypothetical protein